MLKKALSQSPRELKVEPIPLPAPVSLEQKQQRSCADNCVPKWGLGTRERGAAKRSIPEAKAAP
jgi:hypothetical protein